MTGRAERGVDERRDVGEPSGGEEMGLSAGAEPKSGLGVSPIKRRNVAPALICLTSIYDLPYGAPSSVAR